MIIQFFYAGLNFVSRNLLDSAVGGTFMEITLGEPNKFLDNIMANYSQDQRCSYYYYKIDFQRNYHNY